MKANSEQIKTLKLLIKNKGKTCGYLHCIYCLYHLEYSKKNKINCYSPEGLELAKQLLTKINLELMLKDNYES